MNFYECIAQYYEHIFPLNKQQVNFIKDKIPPKPDTKILDLGCAVGTLLYELDKYYLNLYGIDLDEDMVKLAKKRKYRNQLNIFAGDMLNFPEITGDVKFDGIVCFGNTLVHLNDLSSIEILLQKCYKQLTTGGKLLIQIINYDRIIDQKIKSLATIDNEKVKFIRDYAWTQHSKKLDFNTELSIKDTDIRLNNTQALLPIRKSELIELMKDSGFKSIFSYGNFSGDSCQENSIPLIIEAVK